MLLQAHNSYDSYDNLFCILMKCIFIPLPYFFLGVVTHPQSMTVSFNGFAMFNCTAIATSFTWEIDGVLIDDGDLRDKGFDDSAPKVTLNLTQNLRSTSLRVLGSPDSNNVSIACIAIIPLTPFTNDADRSEPALMLVQGITLLHISTWKFRYM